MGKTIETIARVGLWAFLISVGLSATNGWITLETDDFQGLVLFVLAVLVIKGPN